MALNESIISIRVKLQESKLKKTGKNQHAGFEYFELSDFLPTLNVLMMEQGINDIISFGKHGDNESEYAMLTLVKGDEVQTYSMPFRWFETPISSKGAKMMQDIQYLGAINTYLKRYLYMNAFGITDGEIIDSLPKPENKANIDDQDCELQKQKKQLSDLCKVYGVEKSTVASIYGITSITSAKEYKEICAKIIKDNETKAV